MSIEMLGIDELQKRIEEGEASKAELRRRQSDKRKACQDAQETDRLNAVAAVMGVHPAQAGAYERVNHGTLHIVDGKPVLQRSFGRGQGSPVPQTTEYVHLQRTIVVGSGPLSAGVLYAVWGERK